MMQSIYQTVWVSNPVFIYITEHSGYWLIASFLFALFACFGSYLNVVISRSAPRYKLAIATEANGIFPQHASIPLGDLKLANSRRSHCPKCRTQIPAKYNIPILGYFLTKGKCFSCQEKISPQYVLIEVLTAVLGTAAFYLVCNGVMDWTFILLFATICCSIVLIATDVTSMDLYGDHLTSYFVVTVSLFALLKGPDIAAKAALQMVLMVIAYSVFIFLYGELRAVITKSKEQVMGGGDWPLVFAALLWCSQVSDQFPSLVALVIVGLASACYGLVTRTTRIPFAPTLVVATVVAICSEIMVMS